ncbi:target of Nesh-SH3 isoform X26 [Xenopus tropicalis]|uniref:Target of Nesh-SH3 isoform X26 n=1 Tax=Xenopus tropicalis TaxID=8364 RepID=A0A8J1J242_XENTR|nr:target of Nesh-SH3 isoform X26 [Xenopus tropicalis]
MISTIWLLLFCGIISEHLASSQKSTKVKKNNLKVHINATGDTLVMKFLRPNENLKLEGFVLGYGSNFFSNQYIQWPENGKSYVTEVDAEPRYLIALKPNENSKKTCKDKNPAAKPLQLVIGTLTPTSTFLSWGILINPQIDWSVLNKCPNDRFYTVRYREKNKDWMYQLCPTTEIVIDSLKPSTMYEFGVKDNTENGIWSKLYNHKTIPAKSKDNGQIQSTNKISKAILQMASEDTKALIPVTVIKQGFLNLTYFNSQTKTASESTTEKHKATEPPSIPKTTKKPNTEVYKPAVTDQPIVEYLTTDSPTGALELVRGTMESLESQSVYPSSKTFAYVNHGEPQNNPAIQRMSTASFQPKNSYTEWSISTPRTIGLPLVSRMISAPDAITEITIPKAQSGFTQVEREKEMYTQDSTEKSEITNVMDVSPEIYPISTNVPDVNSHIPLEHHGKTVGLPSISPTFLPSANITWKTTEEQTSTKQVTGINEPYTEDDLNITENQDTGNGLPIVPSTLTSHLEITKKMPALIMLTSSKQGLPLVSSTLSPTSAVTMKKTPVPEDPTSLTQAEMFPASPDDRQVSLYTPFQQLRTTMEIPYLQTSKPSPSTEAPRMESGKNSTQSVSETITTEVPHIFEQEKVVATTEEQYVQELGAVSKPETKPTTVFKETQAINVVEEARTTEVQMSSSPSAPKETLATEKPLPKFDPKETHHVPINVIRLHIFGDPNPTIDTTEKSISPKPRATTESPSSTAAPTTMKKMPIHIIKLHIFDNPEATAPSENLTTSSPTPKTTQPHTISQSKPAPKPTQRVPINDISHQLYGDPEVSLVSNTARPPPLPKTTQRAETPQTKPVPNETRKVFPYKPKKPQPTAQPRKPASTEAPGDSIKPKIPPQTPEATFAPYKLQHSSQRPRTSVGSRINPGGRLYDRSKLLGVSRNISVEVNTTIRRTYSVSSAPFLPVQPTIMRRRPHATNVTGRPGSVLMPRAPSTARPNRTAVSIKAPIPSSASPEPEDTVEATVFSPTPKSEIDALGKIRTTGPHITYMTKKQEHPCSITESLKYFPTEEATNQEIVSRPMNPPSNLTIVTVEGCPSFVILDWQPPENDTVTEYKIISTENGAPPGKDQSIITTNQTFQTVENLKPNASYQFLVIPTNPLGEGPASNTVEFSTESADPRVSEPVTGGKDAIWTEIKFKSDSYSECKGKQFVKRTWYKKFVGIQLCNSLRYKIYLSDSLLGTFYNIGDQSGFGEDHCQFVDSFLDGRTGQQLSPEQLTTRKGFYRAVRQQPVDFGNIGGNSQIRYVHWYECGIAIPGKW